MQSIICSQPGNLLHTQARQIIYPDSCCKLLLFVTWVWTEKKRNRWMGGSIHVHMCVFCKRLACSLVFAHILSGFLLIFQSLCHFSFFCDPLGLHLTNKLAIHVFRRFHSVLPSLLCLSSYNLLQYRVPSHHSYFQQNFVDQFILSSETDTNRQTDRQKIDHLTLGSSLLCALYQEQSHLH